MAATGGIVAARNAGHTEAPTVTNMPTAIAATAVRVSKHEVALRRVEAERADHREEEPGEQHTEREARDRRDARR